MCGRFQLTATALEIADEFELEETPELAPRYNIAPGQDVLVVRAQARGGGRRRLSTVRWGLLPHFATEPAAGQRPINARAESAEVKPAFREPFRQRRCLVPAQGFYEWRSRGGVRQPHLVRRRDGGLIAFAGLWDLWQPKAGAPLETCAIVTVAASPLVAPIHDRMPAIVDPSAFGLWLDPETVEPDRVRAALRLVADGELEAVPVSTRVNSVANDDAGCADVVVPEEPAQGRLF